MSTWPEVSKTSESSEVPTTDREAKEPESTPRTPKSPETPKTVKEEPEPLKEDPEVAKLPEKARELFTKAEYLFKAGDYYQASEYYRLCLLDAPDHSLPKLRFGYALFAIGNYSYASYCFRRATTQLDPAQSKRPIVAPLFHSQTAFSTALQDLERYVKYSPKDPAGLTVLAWVLFSGPEGDPRCRAMVKTLLELEGGDPFAAFLSKGLER